MEKENKYYIYFHINDAKNEIFYVGKGFGRRAFRKNDRNKFWKNVTSKYSYTIVFPHKDITEEEAIKLEIYYISKIGRRDLGNGPLVNLTDGGDGSSGYIMTSEHKNKIREKMKGRIFSEEHLKRNRESKIGKQRPESVRKKLSNYRKGKRLSKETKLKISQSGKGRKHSEETKIKISESNKGRVVSNKTRKLLKKRNECKQVLQLDLNNNLITKYTSIKEAARVNNLDAATISRCCHNKKKTSGGFKWKFKN